MKIKLMFSILLISAISLLTPAMAQEVSDTAVAVVEEMAMPEDEGSFQEYEAPVLNERFWKKRKSLRIGYESNLLQNANGGVFPAEFGVGLSRIKSIWLHRKPIANCLKFAFDMGMDVNYTLLAAESDETYTGPSGYLGTEPLPDGESESLMDIPSLDIGSHYLAAGWALGVSATVNPVAQLRVAGYVHFVPSAGVHISGISANLGFMPYLKYGCELSYGFFGAGVEWGTVKGKCIDLTSRFLSENGEGGTSKSLLYSNYTKIYLAFRLGR